jgi:hypothetical protein
MAGGDEVRWLPISELAPMIRRRQLLPVEVAEAALGRVFELNNRLLALIKGFRSRSRGSYRCSPAPQRRHRCPGPDGSE